MSERSRTRDRILDMRSSLDRGTAGTQLATQAIVVRTAAKSTYPTVASAYYYCEVVDVSGLPEEGELGVFEPKDQYLTALNLGSRIPPEGTYLIAVSAGTRWTIRYDG